MLMSSSSSSKTWIEVALPVSSWSRQTKPGDTSASALIGSSAAMNSATSGASVGATMRPMLIWARWKSSPGSTVELWRAAAHGDYSGFGPGAGDGTFLRGGQRTDRTGVAALDTIYPGWYQGRTVHIHVKVHTGGQVVHTGQLYFD